MQQSANARHTTYNLSNVPQSVKGRGVLLRKSRSSLELRKRVAQWLRDAMAQNPRPGGSITQAELARMSDVSRETISNILHEKVSADRHTLHKLAVALKAELPDGGRPVVREVRESAAQYGEPRGPGTAARFYRGIIRQLSADFGRGEVVSVEEAASYVQALWNHATDECPVLEQDVEPDGG